MKADDLCRTEILALVHEAYSRLSTPGSNPGELFGHADMALSGSELGELVYGPEDAQDLAMRAVSLGLTWMCEKVTVWREGDVAWAQILECIKADIFRDGGVLTIGGVGDGCLSRASQKALICWGLGANLLTSYGEVRVVDDVFAESLQIRRFGNGVCASNPHIFLYWYGLSKCGGLEARPNGGLCKFENWVGQSDPSYWVQ